MVKCSYCGSLILAGGVDVDGFRFCSQSCTHKGAWIPRSADVASADVDERTNRLHRGQCPRCAGAGPVDLHTSHWVYSALAFTRWGSRPEICCRSCARWNYLKDGLFSAVFGWWGFPFGLFITPAQVIRDVGGAIGLRGPNPDGPSPELRRTVAVMMAQESQAAERAKAQA